MGAQTTLDYQFLDFHLSRNQQALYYKGKKQTINTKAYHLLLEFVENQGEILSKDHLINTVWHGQIVTDAALAKQILRLRKIIHDDDLTNPIIETHRGVGYRFTAPVNTKNAESGKKSYKTGLFVFIILLVIVAAILWSQNTTTSTETEVTADDVNVVVLSNSEDLSPINLGTLSYLVSLLEQDKSINAFYPQITWPTKNSPDELAIDITSKGKLDYAVLVNFSENAGRFEAQVTLRNQDKVFSKTTLESNQLLSLTQNISQWINQSLSTIDNVLPLSENTPLTNDDYALQSYIQGITAQQLKQDFSKAKNYFEAAVHKDPQFKAAWVQLAYVKIKLNQLTEAISIADTFLPQAIIDNDKGLQFDLHYIKAVAYSQLQEFQKAKESIAQSIQSIEENPNPIQKIHGLKSMILMNHLMKDWDSALKNLNEQLELSESYYPLDHQLASIYLDQALVYAYKADFDQARQTLTKAIHYYSQDYNPDNMIESYALMNGINLTESNYEEGLQIANQAENLLNKTNLPKQEMRYLMSTAVIFNLTGRFDRSEKYIARMAQLAKETNNKRYYLMVEAVTMHAFYVQDKFIEAYNHANTIKATLENNYVAEEMPIFYSWITLIASRVLPPEQALDFYQDMQVKLPVLMEDFATDMNRAKGHILVRLGQVEEGLEVLQDVEKSYREKNEKHVANYVGFEILAILLQHPDKEYQSVINRLDSKTQYDYLFFKLKAQFKARESDYLAAAMLMQENKLKANQLWTAKDQLLLEDYMEKSAQE
ncbi:winged helix-turn-helix domain-containing protein [Marinicella gelatinilytica]|uniref:winged helix-turn-helix domain-containing protein n=1 Tax=Marinicella gelatinilytica TaxID=2996017 RepID=UPI0022608414|nr:winged helix-turn-helix domain-containing protein [Marinicella gelatinilytica]MCX7545428.1 winged helix-turn-helix domain-containing protein [Marinicella gelatinilytica]